jgi:hypothetical protein
MEPSIDVVIPAFLEAGVVDAKIQSLRADFADYGGRCRIIVVASDTESADAAAAADIVLLTGRHGKARACNEGLQRSDADVVVFSDANCQITPRSDWVGILLASLRDWHLVSARKGESGGMDSAFWRLEERIKTSSETTVGTLAVAGEFMAARRSDLLPLTPGVILDDLDIALSFAFRGLSVTSSGAIRTTEPAAPPSEQWERRVRIAQGLFTEALPQTKSLLSLPVGRLFVAHKLARTTVGCLSFWLAVLGTSVLWVPASFALVPAALAAVAGYVGKLTVPSRMRPVVTIFGLQAVPVAGGARALRRSIMTRQASTDGLWRKVAR